MNGSDRTKLRATCFGCVVSIFILSACSGGGGAGGTVPTTPTTATTTSTAPFVTIVSAPADASLHGNVLPLASGTSPNFTASLPANGTTFPLDEAVMKIAYGSNQASVAGYTSSLTGGATLTFQGTASTNTQVLSKNIFELKIPALSLDAPNILANSITTLSDGREVTLRTSALNYSLLGGVTGLAMPGTFDLTGQASVDVNFGTGKVNGSLFNMTSYNSGPALDPEPWNNVSLVGNLSGTTMHGATSVTSAPSSPVALSSSATGTFTGALFGPNAQELGLSWTLYDPSGNGKSAIGVVGATTP
jgi:hypothetical protein